MFLGRSMCATKRTLGLLICYRWANADLIGIWRGRENAILRCVSVFILSFTWSTGMLAMMASTSLKWSRVTVLSSAISAESSCQRVGLQSCVMVQIQRARVAWRPKVRFAHRTIELGVSKSAIVSYKASRIVDVVNVRKSSQSFRIGAL